MSVAVNMPQMAANGLSENWLFKFCGDLHWQVLCRSLGTTSATLQTDSGDRLYPSFVAISARYSAPLSEIKENDLLDESIACARYGGGFFHGQIKLERGGITMTQEMLTAFVSRSTAHGNDLRKGAPAARFRSTAKALTEPPALLTRSAQLRKGTLSALAIESFSVPLGAPHLGLEELYHPSPYIDYNGANLLYYAAYPSICDAGERRLIHLNGLVAGLKTDWAMAASTVAREIFYFKNLDLGEDLIVRLNSLEQRERRVLLHSSLVRAADRVPIAESFTVKERLD